MTVNALQTSHELTDCLGACRDFHLGKFFHTQAVSKRMRMGTDAADPFKQIQVLDPVATFGCLFNATVGITQAHPCCRHNFAVYGELEMARLFQCRMLWSDRNHKRVFADHSLLRKDRRLATSYGCSLFDGEIRTQRKDVLGPVFRDKQTIIALCAGDLEAEHLVQFALEKRRGRNNIFNGWQCQSSARQADSQGGDRGSETEMVKRLHLTGLRSEVESRDRREVTPMRLM